MVNTDKHLVKELTLFIENDGTIYRQRVSPLIKNYSKKIDKNKFNKGMAVKGFKKVVKSGITKYNKEFGNVGRVSEKEKAIIEKALMKRETFIIE